MPVNTKKEPKTREEKAYALFSNKNNWMKPLTNFEIDFMASKLEIPGWQGVFSRDEIPKKLSKHLPEIETYIVNIQPLNNGGGTHWVAAIKDKQQAYYYDSYGMTPVREVLSRYKDIQLTSSTFVMQDLHHTSVYCGMISLYFLYAFFYVHDRDFYKTVLDMYDVYQKRHTDNF